MNNRLKILAIDDNRANLLLITRILEDQYDVTTIISGEEALDNLGETKFDLVLLDIMMPDVDGFKILEYIKKERSATPVIMVSACHEKRYINMAMEKGANGYIKKPFRKKELLETISKALGKDGSTQNKELGTPSEKKKNSGKWFEKYFASALKTFQRKKTILIADDTISDVVLIEHALEEMNYNIISAYDGNSALEMIKGEKPDMVLIDIIMPGKDGLEVLKCMREESGTKDIPVIILSCIHDHQYIQRSMKLGIEAYFSKPYKLTKLVEVIEDVFNENNKEKKIYTSLHF